MSSQSTPNIHSVDPPRRLHALQRLHRAFRPAGDDIPEPPKPGPLGSLSADLIIEILDFLNVDDIVRVRRVNQHLSRITRMGVVWKRALRALRVPIPQLTRPVRTLSYREAESLVIRSLRLHANLQGPCPIPGLDWFESYDKAYILKLLPGGKYLVAACKDPTEANWSIVVWNMDYNGRRLALAKCSTKSAIHSLIVKYMKLKGVDGIAIAYLRTLCGQKTEACVLHISLDSLDQLANPNGYTGDPPFQLINCHKSRCQLGFLTFERGILAIAHRPRTIMLVNLNARDRSFIKLKSVLPTHRHSVWGLKILPDQNQILVIRLIHTDNDAFYAFELYPIPPWGEILDQTEPSQQHFFEEALTQSFAISELYTRQAPFDQPTPAEQLRAHNYASPICIFAQTLKPRGVIHFIITPNYQTPPIAQGAATASSSQIDGGPPTVVYNLPARKVSQYIFEEDDQKATFVPGVDRSIWWTRPHDSRSETPEMVNIFAYLSKSPKNKDLQLKSLEVPDDLADKVRQGTQSVTFDEGSGLLCIATVADSKIYVFDYAA